MNDALTKVSYSQYSLFSTCPLQYKSKYVDGLKDPPNIERVFGSAMHVTIQEWLHKHYNEPAKNIKLFDLNYLFKDKFIETFKKETFNEGGTRRIICDKETFTEYYLDGCEILNHLIRFKNDFFPTSGFELLGVEIPLDYVIEKKSLRYVGYIDIVIRNKAKNKIIIYDLKTSKMGWRDYQKKDVKKLNQLLLYKKFYSDLYNVPVENITVQFIVLKRKISEQSEWEIKRLSRFEPAQGSISMKRAIDSFNSFIDLAFNDDGTRNLENLKPTPSESNCKFCPINNNRDLCEVSYYLRKKKEIK